MDSCADVVAAAISTRRKSRAMLLLHFVAADDSGAMIDDVNQWVTTGNWVVADRTAFRRPPEKLAVGEDFFADSRVWQRGTVGEEVFADRQVLGKE